MFAKICTLTLVGSLTNAVEVVPPPLIVPFEKEALPPQEPTDTSTTTRQEGTPKPNEMTVPTVTGFPQDRVDPLQENAGDFLTGGDGEMVQVGDALQPYDLQIETSPVEDLVFRVDDPSDDHWGGGDLSQPFGESLLTPGSPTGFDGVAGGRYMPNVGEKTSSNFDSGVNTSIVYDSNVQRSSIVPAGASKDDWILSLSPFISYGRKAGLWTYEAGGRIGYNQYLKDNDLSGWDYSVAGKVAYDGGRWNAVLGGGTSLVSGGNRYLGGFAEQILYDASLNLSYELGSKTRFDGGVTFNSTTAESGGSSDTENFGANLAALWKYSPLLELGPGYRFRWESSGASGDRVTLGPLLRTRYRLTNKVALDSDLGINFFDYQNSGGSGGSDQALYAKLGVAYQLSSIWAFNFSIGNDSVVDEAGGFRDTFQLRTAVSRPIRRATWTLGLGYENTSSSGAAGGDTVSFLIDSSIGMKVFGNRGDAKASILWRDQSEDGGGGDWSGVQVGLSLGTTF